jgi:hypothetical protein
MQVFYNESSWKNIAKYHCGMDARIRTWNGDMFRSGKPSRQKPINSLALRAAQDPGGLPPNGLFIHSTAVLNIRHDGIRVTEV